MKSASYRAAVEWIALNDSAADDDDAEAIAGYVTSCLIADIFGVPTERVGADVHRARRLADVDPLEESCPSCKALPGHKCRLALDQPPKQALAGGVFHVGRVRKAIARAKRGGSGK